VLARAFCLAGRSRPAELRCLPGHWTSSRSMGLQSRIEEIRTLRENVSTRPPRPLSLHHRRVHQLTGRLQRFQDPRGRPTWSSSSPPPIRATSGHILASGADFRPMALDLLAAPSAMLVEKILHVAACRHGARLRPRRDALAADTAIAYGDGRLRRTLPGLSAPRARGGRAYARSSFA
jgi:hypothetical protein